MNPEMALTSTERTQRLDRLLEHGQPAVVPDVAVELRHFKVTKQVRWKWSTRQAKPIIPKKTSQF
jgi:hypothetical protein